MYLLKTPAFLRYVFPNILWRVSTDKKEIYLSFDDGPVPEATPWVLDILSQYNAKATFFMVGENIKKHRTLYEDVLSAEHSVGNHTHNHLNGWKTTTIKFIDNVNACEESGLANTAGYFRPPYGRLKMSQYKKIKNAYKIVMWDVLSGDFSSSLSAEDCLRKSIQKTERGSIIVFHDSVKAIRKLKYILPRYLDHFAALNFTFKAL
jgi:peptidoglycan-N-acetylglucosamine deacetylase